jgi:hypothetical protein
MRLLNNLIRPNEQSRLCPMIFGTTVKSEDRGSLYAEYTFCTVRTYRYVSYAGFNPFAQFRTALEYSRSMTRLPGMHPLVPIGSYSYPLSKLLPKPYYTASILVLVYDRYYW